jgi:general secretion pathway protein K
MKRDSEQRGVILVVVLWMVAMMMVTVIALGSLSQKSLGTASVETERLRTKLALEAGLAAGEVMVLAKKAEDRVYFASEPVTVDIGGGRRVEIAIQDAAGLVDLNRADQKLIESLVARLGLSGDGAKAIVGTLMKLRDTGKSKSQPAQQDAAEPKPAQPPVLFSLAQLRAFDGVKPKDLALLLPYVSLYSSDGKVNPMSAPEVVLQAIPDLDKNDAAALAAARKQRQGAEPEVQDVLSRHADFLAIGQSTVFVIGVKILDGPGVIPGSRIASAIVLDEGGKAPFQTLSLSW